MFSNHKNITCIACNYLNLPEVITVTDKGTITYTYDAAGNKLKKITQENNATVLFNGINYTTNITTTTSYIGGSVYESKAYSHSALASLQYTDVLQFMAHEEGRIRPVRDGNNNITGFTYDYFIKDHLGNIRMVLTEEEKQDPYPAASMETAQAITEESLYANISETRVDKPAGYPTDNYTDPNDKVALTSGSGNKIGPSIILKVMAGDKFNLRASSWYKTNGVSPGSPNSIATDLVTNLITSLTGVGGPVHGTITPSELTSSGVMPTTVNGFLNSQPSPGTVRPKAYLNWVFLDEQFKFAGGSAAQVGDDNALTTITKDASVLNAPKNGYLYVFVSNETPNIDVFFDNLQITHIRGPILEETHYYPFGLTMAGISSRAANSLDNKTKFNGKELNEDLDLDWYEYGFRNNFDPQLGRFHSVDPLASDYPYYTPYQFAGNQPTIAIDVDGLEPAFVNNIMTWLTTETAKKPNGAAAVTLGVVAGTGKFVEKTITGVANLVTNPPDLSPQGLANSGVQLGLGVFDRVNTIQNGSTVEKTAAITETVLDVASVVVGTKGAGTALKGEAIVSTAGKIENVASKVKTIEQQASELVSSNGNKSRVTLRSEKAQIDVDLTGKGHNYQGTVIETPHTKVSPRNTQAPASQQPAYNTGSKHASYHNTTQQEIRMVRKYLEKQNQ